MYFHFETMQSGKNVLYVTFKVSFNNDLRGNEHTQYKDIIPVYCLIFNLKNIIIFINFILFKQISERQLFKILIVVLVICKFEINKEVIVSKQYFKLLNIFN